MEPFLVSTGLVALAEIGDKTQLLALLLATRYGRPVPIVLGILAATLANHAGAAAVGAVIAAWVGPEALYWILGLGFLAMAVWALIPDKEPAENEAPKGGLGVFAATAIAFFLVEMGDKTQVATVALAARFSDMAEFVVLGTTLGMMIANVPVVLCGGAIAKRVPLAWVRGSASAAFAVLGVLALAGALGR
jgi:putative Ca2+/H+ antiporter (TMEM165/GDT1 family)